MTDMHMSTLGSSDCVWIQAQRRQYGGFVQWADAAAIRLREGVLDEEDSLGVRLMNNDIIIPWHQVVEIRLRSTLQEAIGLTSRSLQKAIMADSDEVAQ